MENIYKRIRKAGIIPVVVLEDAKDSVPLAKALRDGGIPCAEITFRTEAAEESIRIMTQKYPDMPIGAGTVHTTDQADRAVRAGASFIVSPGFNPRVVKHCINKDIPVIPGCSSPSDIEQAIESGLNVVKFFPAEATGGLKYIKAVAAPYSDILFMPTGGITPDNVRDYLSYDRVIACGGSWMVKSDDIRRKDFRRIRSSVREAREIVEEIRGTDSWQMQ